MGFWNKLGKIALQAAPYVAAPFTGGASLAFTPATQKLGQKWAEHDAKKAIEKGLAPSKFDKYLGMASGVASMASGAGLLGKGMSMGGGGGKSAPVSAAGKQLSGWQQKLGQAGNVASMASTGRTYANDQASMGGGGGGGGNGLGGWQGQLAGIAGDVIRSQMSGESSNQNTASNAPVDTRASGYVNGFPVNAGQARPRGTSIIDMGRNAALMSQPWRTGYDVRSEGPDDAEGNPQVITTKNPAIYPNYNPPVQAPPISESGGNQSGSIFGDQLTQRYGAARKRNPAPVEEEY